MSTLAFFSRALGRGAAAFALTTLAAQIAVAFPVENEGGSIKGSFNSTLTSGFGVRAQSPSCGLHGDPSVGGCGLSANAAMWSAGDDGNLNYKKGQLFTAYVKGTHELLLSVPEHGVSMMARASYLLDGAATRTRRTELDSDSERKVARDLRLLDLWVSKDFDVGDNRGKVKIGNQVINWGESLFMPGGINTTNSLDYQRLLIPGTQLKEAVLPAPMLSFNTGIGRNFNVEGYYQFRWNSNRYAPIGTYWSAADIFDDGRRQPGVINAANFNVYSPDGAALIRRDPARRGARISQDELTAINSQLINGDFFADPTNPSIGVPILPNNEPRDRGQYGLALKVKPDWTSAEFGFYAARYHDKTPVLNFVGDINVPAGGSYQYQFLESRTLYGVSTNFQAGNWAIGAELSYRPKDAISLGSCFTPGQPLDANVNFNPVPGGSCPLWMDKDKYELHVTGLLSLLKSEHHFILDPLRADAGFVSLEFVATRYPGVNPNGITRNINGVEVVQLPAAGYITWLSDRSDPAAVPRGVGTANSYGVIGDFNVTYDGTLIGGWQVTPGFTYFRALKGDTPNMSGTYLKGVQSLNVYVLFNQNPATWQAGLNYSTYFGGGERNVYKDRDFVGGFVSYNF